MASVGAVLGGIEDIERPQLRVVDGINSVRLSWNSFSDQDYDDDFGFTREECIHIYNILGVPERFMFHENTRHQFQICGVHCFLYYLYHWRTTAQRQTVDTREWGYDYSVLSKMFNKVVEWMDEKHGFRLRNLAAAAPKFAYFNERIYAKVVATCKAIGYPVPPEAERCTGFYDASRFKTCKPDVSY